MEWQLTSSDNWELGTMVRGIVRDVKAEVYFDEEREKGGWTWFVFAPFGKIHKRGIATTLLEAIGECEKLLGIQ